MKKRAFGNSFLISLLKQKQPLLSLGGQEVLTVLLTSPVISQTKKGYVHDERSLLTYYLHPKDIKQLLLFQELTDMCLLP